MIQPINGYILIEPLEHKTFLQGDKSVYEEVGIVRGIASNPFSIQPSDKVWFDAWLAAKYPTGKDDEFFWLVRMDDIRAVEKNEKNEISK